jgi:hypothetical protein
MLYHKTVSVECNKPSNQIEPEFPNSKIEDNTKINLELTKKQLIKIASERFNVESSSSKVETKDVNSSPPFIKVIRQSKPNIMAVSFDTSAANCFVAYVLKEVNSNLKRGGIMYGTADSILKKVDVNAIFEPHQNGVPHKMVLDRHNSEEDTVDFLATQLGMHKVGWIFTLRTGRRSYNLRDHELVAMSELQNELGPHAVTCAVSIKDINRTHLETYQASELCVKLEKTGRFSLNKIPKTKMQIKSYSKFSNKIILVNGKKVENIDTDWFMQPINIVNHKSTVQTKFNSENRVLVQHINDLKYFLEVTKLSELVSLTLDFHLLLWLSRFIAERKDKNLYFKEVNKILHFTKGYKILIKGLSSV